MKKRVLRALLPLLAAGALIGVAIPAAQITQTFTLQPGDTLNLVINSPASASGLTIAPSAPALTVTQGNSGTATIAITPTGGFTGSVTLSAAGLPAGVTASFAPNPATGSSVLAIAAAASATAGTSKITVTGVSGGVTASTTLSLTVGSVACTPTPIVPFLQVNAAAWQQVSTATVAAGSIVNLGPQPIAGTWSWTGPSGFTSAQREIDAIPLSAGANTFAAKYVAANSCASTQTFVITSGAAVGPVDPPTTASFTTAIAGMAILKNYQFGTDAGRNVHNIADLAAIFDPYGIAGTTVINNEWERYQTFNTSNHVFNSNSLALTATIPAGGGLQSGGINSGQIFSKQTYQPGVSGANVYAFEYRAQIPAGPGMWPAMWFYVKDPNAPNGDGSEIDVEFFNMANQSWFDWTGFNHGPGAGADLYSIQTNQWVWHPGIDFSAAMHDYQFYWTTDMIYKYVDGLLVKQTAFKWTAGGQSQFIANLAVGSDSVGPGLFPTSLSQFPARFVIDHITIWSK